MEKLSKIFSKWILKQWRVTGNDGEKKKTDYNKLKELWEKHKNKDDVISFWLETPPELTIPPYQDIKNRRPPKCQTLLLNKAYLQDNYPQWTDWLKELETHKEFREYKKSLKEPKSQRDKVLVSNEEIELRTLQFILDSSKKSDVYQLNEIWNCHNRYNKPEVRDKQKISDEYQEFIEKSELPSSLKKELAIDLGEKFKEKTFGHFVNKYYKTRKRTKEGRYFLHQEKKSKWLDDGKLFTICTHKPKQKKHQLLFDLASIFGLDINDFCNTVDSSAQKVDDSRTQKIEDWLKSQGIKTHCQRSSEAQKNYKGALKYKIQEAVKSEGKNTKDLKPLADLDKKSKEFSKNIAQNLWPDEVKEKQKKRAKRFESVFSFAQIHNIAFKDRSGFSKTCPICSVDNSERMKDPETEESSATASRLNSLSIRLIDGAIMRICDRLSNHIANKIWLNIEKSFENEQKNLYSSYF